ncbi:CBU_0592 family membrane protein [Mangrovicoccus ximenensis]|uniref:CBU_0592 family membrane protein n=1 Tax=Mangrovicoccus ximenensis TaxID=1911570 RepID=UPI000D33DBD4|nr:hypothetical protein [Mangrovicoccus ximenensis]
MDMLERAGAAEILGVAGFALYAVAYAGISIGRITGDSPSFYALNGLAALAVLASLTMDFNLGSVMIQVFYLAVSLAGLWSRLRAGRPGATACAAPAPSYLSPP